MNSLFVDRVIQAVLYRVRKEMHVMRRFSIGLILGFGLAIVQPCLAQSDVKDLRDRIQVLERLLAEVLDKVTSLESELRSLRALNSEVEDSIDEAVADDDAAKPVMTEWTVMNVHSMRLLEPDPAIRANMERVKEEIAMRDAEYRRLAEKYNAMVEENNRAFNGWQRREYPYWRPERGNAAFQKPHGDKELGTIRSERDGVDRRRKKLQADLHRFNKEFQTIRCEVNGTSVGERDGADARLYIVTFVGAVAERVQKTCKPGDELRFKGKWIDGNGNTTVFEGTHADKANK